MNKNEYCASDADCYDRRKDDSKNTIWEFVELKVNKVGHEQSDNKTAATLRYTGNDSSATSSIIVNKESPAPHSENAKKADRYL